MRNAMLFDLDDVQTVPARVQVVTVTLPESTGQPVAIMFAAPRRGRPARPISGGDGVEPAAPRDFKCRRCGDRFSTARGLSGHSRTVHTRNGRRKMLKATAKARAARARDSK